MSFPKGAKNPRFRGGIWITTEGYIWIKVDVDHPCNRAGKKGYAPLHLLVFWRVNGRLPFPGHHVHHDDENKFNVAPDNLIEKESSDHGKIHLTPERARIIGRKGGKATAKIRQKLRRGK